MKLIELVAKKINKVKSKTSLHEYGYEVMTFNLEKEGRIQYARWNHPYDKPTTLTQDQVDFFRLYSKKGGLSIDIGSYSGDTTVPMAIAIGPEGTALGLEPNPHVYKILEKNSELNKDKAHIVPLNFAATDHDGEFEFNYSDASFCNGGFFQSLQTKKHGHKHVLKVQGKNLEAFLRESYGNILGDLCLIKIDAEGYDKEIIKSLKNLIILYKPNIISECNKNLTPAERDDLFTTLIGFGYEVYKMEGFSSTLKPVRIEKSSEMMKWHHFDLVAMPVS